MEVEFEILAILATAFLFTIAGVILENYKSQITFKMLAAVAWWSLALGFTASSPSFLGFSLLFMGIGVLLFVFALFDVLNMMSTRKGEKFTESGWRE